MSISVTTKSSQRTIYIHSQHIQLTLEQHRFELQVHLYQDLFSMVNTAVLQIPGLFKSRDAEKEQIGGPIISYTWIFHCVEDWRP